MKQWSIVRMKRRIYSEHRKEWEGRCFTWENASAGGYIYAWLSALH
jgi:hypothetical protein